MGNIKGLFHLKRFCSALAFAVCVTSKLHYKLIPVNKIEFTIEHFHNCRVLLILQVTVAYICSQNLS